jgi:hypothetical protein
MLPLGHSTGLMIRDLETHPKNPDTVGTFSGDRIWEGRLQHAMGLRSSAARRAAPGKSISPKPVSTVIGCAIEPYPTGNGYRKKWEGDASFLAMERVCARSRNSPGMGVK